MSASAVAQEDTTYTPLFLDRLFEEASNLSDDEIISVDEYEASEAEIIGDVTPKQQRELSYVNKLSNEAQILQLRYRGINNEAARKASLEAAQMVNKAKILRSIVYQEIDENTQFSVKLADPDWPHAHMQILKGWKVALVPCTICSSGSPFAGLLQTLFQARQPDPDSLD